MKKNLLISSILVGTLFFFMPIFSAQAAMPIRILLVPGHDNQIWGAQYGNLKEADMNLALATKLYNILKQDKRFQVFITRDSNGYTKTFADYFANHQGDIVSFMLNAKTEMQNKIANGTFVEKTTVVHNHATDDVVLKLYGINKWADDNKMDAVIHIHFNDYPRPTPWTVGKYKGFVIYVPDDQFVNSATSATLAKSIFTQLKKKYITSTYPPEAGGLVPDQKLIAMGSNETLIASVRSVLIEYGYIYRFGNSTMRHQAYTNMANLTATGIKNYFFLK